MTTRFDLTEVKRADHEGDEAGRCGGCGSRRLQICKTESTVHGICLNCHRLQEVETRDWPESTMCDNCAFRKGSPERADPYRWAEIQETLESGQPFHCHKGLAMHLKEGGASFDPPNESEGRMTVCAGWLAMFTARFR